MDKKVIVITGASSGIGAALCKKMGAEGWCVVLASRRLAELEKIASGSGTCTLIVPTDVTKRSDMDHLKKKSLEKFGRIDVWVNNAGRGIGKRVIDLTEQDLDEIMNVNFKSVFFWNSELTTPGMTRDTFMPGCDRLKSTLRLAVSVFTALFAAL